MKKLLFGLLFMFAFLIGKGQPDIAPTDTAFHNLATYSFRWYTKDSSFWAYMGKKYGHVKLVTNGRMRFLIDSLATVADTSKYWKVMQEVNGDTIISSINMKDTLNLYIYKLKADTISSSGYRTRADTIENKGTATVYANSLKAPASGSANYIQNQNASAQTANMWITGNGRFGGYVQSIATASPWIKLTSTYTASSENRNWDILTNADAWGNFDIRMSATKNTDPSISVLTIKNNGYSGWGTVSPTHFMTLERSSNSGSSNTFPCVKIKNTLTTKGDGFTTFNDAEFKTSAGNDAVIGGIWAEFTDKLTGFQVGSADANPTNIVVNDLPRMTFLSDGNAGIGIQNPIMKLQVLGNVGVGGYGGGDYQSLSMGASGNGYGTIGYNVQFTNTWPVLKYLVSDVSSWLDFDNGTINFNTATSGTANDVITPTKAMSILNSGKVGIGYTNPGTYKLAVNGSGYYDTDITSGSLAGSGDRIAYANSTGVLTSSAVTLSGGILNYGATKTLNSPYDLTPREYVDAVATGLAPKLPCDLATTTGQNLDLSGVETIDGTSTTSGTSRVLVKNQSTTSQNGVYIAQSGAWTRSTDLDTWAELYKAYVVISGGSTNIGTSWICTIGNSGTINSDPITWQQFGIANTITAGIGLTRSGDDIHANVDDLTTTISNDTIRIKSMTSATLAGKITDETGSGAVVFGTSPTLTDPALGTPSALIGTNITGFAANFIAGGAYTLNSSGNYVWVASDLPNAYGTGIANSFVQPSDGWPSYGSLLNMKTYSGGGGSLQLYTPYSTAYGGNRLQWRSGNYAVSGGNSWTTFREIANVEDLADYLPLDGSKPMTGTLEGIDATFSGTVQAETLKTNAITFPTIDGSNGQVMATNGSGTVTWVAKDAINTSVQAPSWSSTVSWNVNSGVNMRLSLDGNTTISMSNLVAGMTGNITIRPHTTTNYTLTISGATYSNKISPIIRAGTNQLLISAARNPRPIDKYSWDYDGEFVTWNGTRDYQ